MTIKKIITVPDPILKEVSEPINKVDSKTQSLLDDMLETMYEAPGIGLAAVQVGIPLRLVVIDVSWNKEDGNKDPKFLINPKIVSKSEKLSSYEFADVQEDISKNVVDFIAEVSNQLQA